MSLNDHSQRDHALLAASSSARWLACPPSGFAAELYAQQDTEYTREGTLAHEVAEAIARQRLEGGELTDNNPDITGEMVDCANSYADYIEEQLQSETATVLLEQRVDFSPWVPDGFGTADCIIIQGDTLDVIDYKYGQGVKVEAEANSQMKLYGLGALNEYGFVFDVKRVRLHIYQPRMNNISVAELTVDELITWADKTVKPTAEKAAKGKGKYSPGAHCKFCQHAGRCRALTKTCTEYVESHSLRVGVPVLAPFEVAEVLQMEPLISLWLKKVKDQALTTLMDGGEVPGFKVVAGRGTRQWADELEVAAELEKQGIDREDYTKTEILSVAQMEKKLGKKKVGELLEGHILTLQDSPTIAPISDKRPVYNRLEEAQKDFE